MKNYPISIHRESYRGSNPKQRANVSNRNRIAAKVEDFINTDLGDRIGDTVQVYMSYAIASSIGEDSAVVHEVIFATDDGSNGITVVKGDYQRALRAG